MEQDQDNEAQCQKAEEEDIEEENVRSKMTEETKIRFKDLSGFLKFAAVGGFGTLTLYLVIFLIEFIKIMLSA